MHTQDSSSHDPYGLWQLTVEFGEEVKSWTKLIGTQEQVKERAEEMVKSVAFLGVIGYSLVEVIHVYVGPTSIQYAPIEDTREQLL